MQYIILFLVCNLIQFRIRDKCHIIIYSNFDLEFHPRLRSNGFADYESSRGFDVDPGISRGDASSKFRDSNCRLNKREGIFDGSASELHAGYIHVYSRLSSRRRRPHAHFGAV